MLRKLLKVHLEKIIEKFDFYVQIFLVLSLTFVVLKKIILNLFQVKKFYILVNEHFIVF